MVKLLQSKTGQRSALRAQLEENSIEAERATTKALWVWWRGMSRQERVEVILNPQYKSACNRLLATMIAEAWLFDECAPVHEVKQEVQQ